MYRVMKLILTYIISLICLLCTCSNEQQKENKTMTRTFYYPTKPLIHIQGTNNICFGYKGLRYNSTN